jgi:hypothetical protein
MAKKLQIAPKHPIYELTYNVVGNKLTYYGYIYNGKEYEDKKRSFSADILGNPGSYILNWNNKAVYTQTQAAYQILSGEYTVSNSIMTKYGAKTAVFEQTGCKGKYTFVKGNGKKLQVDPKHPIYELTYNVVGNKLTYYGYIYKGKEYEDKKRAFSANISGSPGSYILNWNNKAVYTQTQALVTMQQKENMRYLDASERRRKNYRAVTRTAQGNDSQKWVIKKVGDGEFTMQQKVNMRYLDAYEKKHNYRRRTYRAVTRKAQGNDSQKWVIKKVDDGEYTVQQKVNMRYLDAYQHRYNSKDVPVDYQAVTAKAQNYATKEGHSRDSQRWVIRVLEN